MTDQPRVQRTTRRREQRVARAGFGMLALGVALLVLTSRDGIGSLAFTPLQSNERVQMDAGPSLPATVAVRNLLPLSDQPWNRLTNTQWNYLRRSSSKDADIIADLAAPFSPRNVLRMVFTPKLEPDREPSVHWIGLPLVSEVYATWWIKLSPNWSPSPAGGGKMTFLWPPGNNGVLYSNIGGSKAPHRINVATTWSHYGYRFWEPNVTSVPVFYDRWYRVEWYVKWESSPAAGDGIIRWWVNERLNGNYESVRFPSCCLLQFEFAPTLQHPPPADQYMYVDHTWIAAR